MEKSDILIISLFFVIFFMIFLTLYEINKFMPILKTCDDDFKVINKCGCIPCNWKIANESKELCINLKDMYG